MVLTVNANWKKFPRTHLAFWGCFDCKVIGVFFVSMLAVGLCAAQGLTVVYENNDGLNGLKRDPGMRAYLPEGYDVIEMKATVVSSLMINDKYAVYKVDSLYLEHEGQYTQKYERLRLYIFDFEGQRSLEIMDVNPEHSAKLIAVEEEDWDVHLDKSKVILGMKCHFAECRINNKHHRIWFTTEVPYYGGPFKAFDQIRNPPGLVLEHTQGDGYNTMATDIRFVPSYDPVDLSAMDIIEDNKFGVFHAKGRDLEGMVVLNGESEVSRWYYMIYPPRMKVLWGE